MKSTIKIGLGENNEPIIHFNIVPSDDLRDQVCCQFLHKLGGTSNVCLVNIVGNDQNSPITHMLEIIPWPNTYIIQKSNSVTVPSENVN